MNSEGLRRVRILVRLDSKVARGDRGIRTSETKVFDRENSTRTRSADTLLQTDSGPDHGGLDADRTKSKSSIWIREHRVRLEFTPGGSSIENVRADQGENTGDPEAEMFPLPGPPVVQGTLLDILARLGFGDQL